MEILTQFKDYLLSQRKPPSRITVKNYLSDVNQFISWFEKDLNESFSPKSVTNQTIELFRKESSTRISPASLERKLSSLRKFFQFLKIQDVISISPLEKLDTQKLEEGEPLPLKSFRNFLYVDNASSLTIKNYLNDVKQFFKWAEAVTGVQEAWDVKEKNVFNKTDDLLIGEYKNRLLEQNFSPKTINRKLSSLRKYLTWAQKEGLIKMPISEFPDHESLRSGTPKISPSLEKPEEITIAPKRRIAVIRLLGKIMALSSYLVDLAIVNPSAGGIKNIQYLIWKLRKKPIFEAKASGFPSKRQGSISSFILGSSVPSISKSFYAPLSTSTRYLPLHKKIIHHLRHNRPKWYRKYHSYAIAHYLNFAILIVFASIIGFSIYQSFFQMPKTGKPALAVSPYGSRILSFRERLTDSLGNPITSRTSLRFSIYNDPKSSGSSLLWGETNTVKPDQNGDFSIELGKNNIIPSNIFLENSILWLGISVGGTPELVPRQKLPNVLYANDAQTLQGLQPITNAGNGLPERNVVLALDSSGNLSIGGEISHTFQSINGQFILSGNILTLSTVPGTNSNIELSPDGFGKIDLQKPLQNSTNNNNIPTAIGGVEIDDLVGILATSSGQSALTINQNDIGPIISASSSGIARFTVDSFGNTTIDGDIALSGISPSITSSLNNSGFSIGAAGAGILTLQPGSSGNIQFFSSLNTISANGALKISGSLTLASPSATTTLGGITYAWPTGGQSNGYLLKTDGSGNLSWTGLPNITNWWSQTGGNVGIGTTNPNFRLDIQDSQTATVAAQIFNTNTGTDADGLTIKLGNTSTTAVDNANHFISFETSGIGIVGSVRGNGKGVQYQTNGIADFAEYLKKDEKQSINYGSVLCIDDKGLVYPCGENGNIAGVASSHPSFLGGEDLGNKSVAVGLSGVVLTKTSDLNGPIKAGDLLTTSSLPGFTMKATKPGTVIGKALESFDSTNCQAQTPQSDKFGLIESSSTCKGEILVLLSIGYNDPNPPIVSTVNSLSDFTFKKVDSLTNEVAYQVIDAFGQIMPRVKVLAGAIIANLKAGIINAEEITTKALAVSTDSVSIQGQSLRDYVKNTISEILSSQGRTDIISPIAQINEIHTNIISPLGQDKDIIVRLASGSASKDSSFVIQNSSESAVATINSNGDASFSGRLSASNIQSAGAQLDEATISGTLHARKIITDQIESTPFVPPAATLSAEFAYVDRLNAKEGNFSQGLMSLGPSSFSDVSIAAQLSVGASLTILNNSINVLGENLELQPLKQGGVSIMSGLIYIDTDGNLKVSGNAQFAKDVTVRGVLAANIIAPIPDQDIILRLGTPNTNKNSSFAIHNSSSSAVFSINMLGDFMASGSGTFNKLNLSFIQPALAVSPTEIIATGSAGIATISATRKEVTIDNDLVTDRSLIYVTPKTDTENLVLYLIRQIPQVSFTIGINTPLQKDVPFNWIIVN
ncbi:MAG: site-specific integrase [Patescibacteria group bacterium]|nr:site-specific integrase [Patescibacteria group bacterium]